MKRHVKAARRGHVTVWRGDQAYMFSDATVGRGDSEVDSSLALVVSQEHRTVAFYHWDRYEIVYDTGAQV